MSNLTLAHPWLLALLPLPLFIWWLVPPHSRPRRALVVPFLPRLEQAAGRGPARGATVARGSAWRWLLVVFCWLCVVLAMARPQVIEPPISKDIPVRDLLLAVDLSGSMATRDFQDARGQTVDRLTAVKSVLDGFLARREGDRVGLIFFGSAPFVQAPFTEDLSVCRELLDEAQVKMAGPQTAFGDALGLAINVFDRSTVKERVLIALTDGNDTASQVPPDKAAQIARDKGIVIHTVAVGDPRAAGEDALDEASLKRVASTTGGLYSHAADRGQLQAIYRQLDQIETRKVQSVSHSPRRDVYWWPLAIAVLASMLYFSAALVKVAWGRRTTRDDAPGTLADAAPAGLMAALLAFHFIRPLWLLLLLPAAALWWQLRRRSDTTQAWRRMVAPHLLAYLWSGEEGHAEGRAEGHAEGHAEGRARFGPLQWIALSWLVAIVAIAGPTWRHEPSPFAEDIGALAVVVKVSPSMETEDVQPSRMERATQKLHDLLALRGNARTSLIAYAGSAHRVMPATRDAGIIDTFAQALVPDIMPSQGDAAAAALELAQQSLDAVGGGSILWITDGIAPEQGQALAAWRRRFATELRVFPPLMPGSELEALRAAARAVNATVVPLAADNSDVAALASAARYAAVSDGDADTRWAESGYWLTPLIALLLLPFFRRGWLVPVGGET